MICYRHLAAAALALAALLFTACGEPPLHGSDADMARVFGSNQFKFFRLIKMADHDKAQVLWLSSHELQPSDLELSDERWGEYDVASRDTGVRRLERVGNDFELDVSADSDSFMHTGAVKGYVFSGNALQPVVSSLDKGVPVEHLRNGHGIAYRRLSLNWYLFFRQE